MAKQKLDKEGFSDSYLCDQCQRVHMSTRVYIVSYILYMASIMYLFFPLASSFFDDPIPLFFEVAVFIIISTSLIYMVLKTQKHWIMRIFEFRKISSLQSFNYDSGIEIARLCLNRNQHDLLSESLFLEERVISAENCCESGFKERFKLLTLRSFSLFSLTFLFLFFSLLIMKSREMNFTVFLFICFITLLPLYFLLKNTISSYKNPTSYVLTNLVK